METITRGMTVRSLDDRTVGVVVQVNPCCFRFEAADGTHSLSITAPGIFDVQHQRVSLIYVANEAHRYGCLFHPATAYEPSQRAVPVSAPVRVGVRVPVRLRSATDQRLAVLV